MSHTKRLLRELRTMDDGEKARRLAGLEAALSVERNALVRSSLGERIRMVQRSLLPKALHEAGLVHLDGEPRGVWTE